MIPNSNGKPENNGGEVVPYKKGPPAKFYEPRCKVCTNPHRSWIELLLTRGYTPSAIERSFANSQDPVPRRSVTAHKEKGHMNIEDEAMRAIIEYEADLEGKLHDESVHNILTLRSMLDIMARKGFEDVLANNVTVEPRDMIQIARVKNEMDQTAATAAVEEAKLQVQIMAEAVKIAFPERDDQARVVAAIRKLKANYGLENAERLLEKNVPIDAEVVDP